MFHHGKPVISVSISVGLWLTLLVTVSFIVFRMLNGAFAQRIPGGWDAPTHLLNAADYYGFVQPLNVPQLFRLYHFYPPFVYLFLAGVYRLAGYSPYGFAIVNIFFLAVSVVGVLRFFAPAHDRIVGIISTIVFCALTLLSYRTGVRIWEFMLDFPLAVSVLFTYMVTRDGIVRRNYSTRYALFVGCCAAVALLTKWTAGIFIAVPVMFYGVFLFRTGSRKSIVALIVPIIMASGWYIAHAGVLYSQLMFFAWQEGYNKGDPQGLSGFFSYAERYIRYVYPLLPLLVVFSVILVIPVLRKWRSAVRNLLRTEYLFDAAFLFFPMIVFGLVLAHKDERYLFPVILIGTLMLVRSGVASALRLMSRELLAAGIILVIASLLMAERSVIIGVKPSAIGIYTGLFERNAPENVAYFFEDDAEDFNYANVALFHMDRSIRRNKRSVFKFLNSFSEVPASCADPDASFDVLVVYTNRNAAEKEGSHVSYEDICPPNVRNRFERVERVSPADGEEILYYRKKSR